MANMPQSYLTAGTLCRLVSEQPREGGAVSRARRRAGAAKARGEHWVETRDEASRTGVAIGAWRRYQAVDGPLQSLALTTYILIAVVPAMLVVVEYLERRPAAFAHHLVTEYDLSKPTAALVRSVLVEDSSHHLGSALFAIAGALFFGLNFGKVIQLVHLRAWRIELPSKSRDQLRFAYVLLGLYGLLLLLFAQEAVFRHRVSWAGFALSPLWVVLLVGYFAWAPWLLTHRLLGWRELLPGAALTALGLVVLMVISAFVMEHWLNLYAKDYGGFGVVMAIYFWIALSSAVIVWSAALGPALAVRRAT
jgi:membrane protein